MKWLESPFDAHDLQQLQNGAQQVPGFDAAHTGLVAVSRPGTNLAAAGVDLLWGPDDVVGAWPS